MTNRDTEEKLRKLASVDTQKASTNWRFYLSGEGIERQQADDLLDILLFQAIAKDYRKQILLEPPPASVCAGGYALGSVCYPSNTIYSPFELLEHEWIQHVLMTGMTGTGKTNAMFHILREFAKHKKPFLVFDWKRNYRDLRQLPELQHILVFTVGSNTAPFRFNPLLPPPGTEPGHWLMKLVDVMKHAYFVGEGVEYLLRDAIDFVYEQCGLHDGIPVETPTFFMVREFVHKRRVQGRMALWKASAVRVLASLCFRHGLGPVVNTGTSWDYETLLNTGVVLELDALSDSDKIFFTEVMILWLYEYRKHEGKRETFKHALVIEEGHHILSHMKEVAAGAETIMETSLRQSMRRQWP